MKKTLLTMFIAAAATLMVACGGRGTNEAARVATDSICDSVATAVVPCAATEVLPAAAPGDSGKVATEVIPAE